MKIVEKRIDEIKPYEKNPRKNEKAVDKVAESIKQFGFKVPIVIDRNGIIVAGHTRWMASKELKLEVVPCIIADDLNEKEIRAFRIADNKVAEFSDWDFDLLKIEIEDLLDFDMGFDVDELDFVIDESGEIIEDDFDVDAELEKPATVKRGQIWQLGKHKLMCGDSTTDDVNALMEGKKADMYLTDPPYNVNYEGGTGLKIQNDNMDNDSFRLFLHDAFKKANENMKPGAVFYIWHADSEGYNFRGACFDIGWKVRQCLIWVKNSIVMGRQDYHWKHEPCLYGWKDGAAHNWNGGRKERTTITGFDLFEIRNMKKEDLVKFIEQMWCDSEQEETSIIFEDKPFRSTEHPTMKPVKLIYRQLKNNTDENSLVYDGFGGSGSTLIACEQTNRTCYMMELDEKYCDVIINRWEQFTGEKAILIKGV